MSEVETLPAGVTETGTPRTCRITMRYFAGAAAAAGTTDEHIALPAECTLAALLDRIAAERPALRRVFAASSYLLDGVAQRDRQAIISDGAQLDVLPPFAGG